MADYKSGPKFVTPRGTAIWPRLNTPDTKFDAAGVYECKVALDGSDPIVAKIRAAADQLIDEKIAEVLEKNPEFLLEEAYDAKVAELKAAGKTALIKKLVCLQRVDPIDVEVDEDGDETGKVMIKAKMKATGTYKKGPKTGQQWKRKPNIFNAQGVQLKNPPEIGGGSELKLSIELNPYYAASDKKVGVSFRLEAAQLIKLVTFGARDASAYGFGAEEGDDIGDGAEEEFGAGAQNASDAEDDEL